jgi:hypothetical protein
VRGTSDKYVAFAYLIRKKTRYARTVNNGERPLIVWTSETGICEVAIELRICPSNWNPARGRAVMITSRDGRNMPLRRAGIAVFNPGKSVEQYVRSRHQNDTKANCIRVSVTGLGSAVNMDLEDVLVTADVMYQTIQRPISLYDTGAFKASAISCAFALILAFLFLIVVIVSLMLLRGRCFDAGL